ncbi:MAG TPA: hypothetical protein VNU68_15800 [Verrucomicrobiae bacterium]|nr:hypothetical protein [Verrucomicrobiae bacterium]
MSLKAFHVLFIAVSILLAFGFAFWELKLYAEQRGWMELGFGLGSFVSGVGLIVYGRYVLKKLKHISYL